MEKWKKLEKEEVIDKYLVPSNTANKVGNSFYGIRTNASIPVDQVGQFLAFLTDENPQIKKFHFATLASEFHEWFDDYNPIKSLGLGQDLYLDTFTAREMVSIIQSEYDILQNLPVDISIFQEVGKRNLQFSEISYSDNAMRKYYLQVQSPNNISNYLYLSGHNLSGQRKLFMKVLQIQKSTNPVMLTYNKLAANSCSALLLDRSGAEELCHIIQAFIKRIEAM